MCQARAPHVYCLPLMMCIRMQGQRSECAARDMSMHAVQQEQQQQLCGLQMHAGACSEGRQKESVLQARRYAPQPAA